MQKMTGGDHHFNKRDKPGTDGRQTFSEARRGQPQHAADNDGSNHREVQHVGGVFIERLLFYRVFG